MSTSHRSHFDRLADWILDRDGDIYGSDERERLHYYEAIVVGASIQFLVLVWTLGILAWFAGGSMVGTLFIVFAAVWLPLGSMSAYLTKRRVDAQRFRWSAKRIVGLASILVPTVLFMTGCWHAVGAGATDIGIGLAFVVFVSLPWIGMVQLQRRRRLRRWTAEEDAAD